MFPKEESKDGMHFRKPIYVKLLFHGSCNVKCQVSDMLCY